MKRYHYEYCFLSLKYDIQHMTLTYNIGDGGGAGENHRRRGGGRKETWRRVLRNKRGATR
jgi:hypothetical protein